MTTDAAASTLTDYDAIVLSGGGGSRLGGVDKAMIAIGGKTLLETALDAVVGAAAIVVVGPPSHAATAATWASEHGFAGSVTGTREEPAGGGPVAAIAAGIALTRAEAVVIVASDLPFLTSAVADRVVAALAANPGVDAALLVDDHGRRQQLTAAYRRAALVAAIDGLGAPGGRAVREVVGRLDVIEVHAGRDVTMDVDTQDDLDRARGRWEGR